MCQAQRLRQFADHPRMFDNTQCLINHYATRAIALDSGKIRPSIFFLIIVLITSNYRIIS